MNPRVKEFRKASAPAGPEGNRAGEAASAPAEREEHEAGEAASVPAGPERNRAGEASAPAKREEHEAEKKAAMPGKSGGHETGRTASVQAGPVSSGEERSAGSKEKRGVIFDMDGTLWDSVDEIVFSWNRALEAFPGEAVTVTRETLLGLMGKTMDRFAEGLFPGLPLPRAMEILHVCERRENDYLRENGARLLGDVEGTFRRLRESGSGVYIVSNCQAGYIEAFLDFFRLEHLVDDFECYGNTRQGKAENLRALIERNGLTDCCYVGDTQGDYEACRAAGVPFVWASYGFGSVDADVPSIASLDEI